MKKHINISVTGIVQGVFFRASTKEKADALGLSGFVRNQPDGSVYIEAEGDAEALESFIAWCEHGPPHAVVNDCQVAEAGMKGLQDFVIKR